VEKAIVPDYALSSHVAPLGLVFYTADSLPQKFRGGAFVSEHGSWDRQEFKPFERQGRGCRDRIPEREWRSVADDMGNTVWRVTSAGQ